MKIIDVVSVCCNAEVKTSVPLLDFVGDNVRQQDITMYYICSKCNNDCNIKEEKSNGKKKI